MPDEGFELFWRLRGAPEMVALHGLFAGSTAPADEVRQSLGLTLEQFNAVMQAGGSLGLVTLGGDEVGFPVIPADSSQRSRLDWCLETHLEELKKVETTVKSRLVLRFLGRPPKAGL